MWRSHTFWRLFGTFGVLLLAALVLLGFAIVNRVEQQLLQQIRDSLRTRVTLVREIVQDWPTEKERELQQRVVQLGREIAQEENTPRITLIAESGRVLADSDRDPHGMDNHANRPEVQRARANGFGTSTRFSETLRTSMIYMALRARESNAKIAFVRVALPLDNVWVRVAELHRIVWTGVAITGVAAMGLAFWLTRRLTRPLAELTAGAANIAAGNYGHKVYITANDEVGTLARTFNQMSLRLAAQFAQVDEDRQQLRAILSGMLEGVVALDARQQILFVNERAAQLLEFQAKTAVGRRFWEVVRQAALQGIVHRALTNAEPFREELNWHGPGIKSLTVHAARLADTPARGIILVFHDTTGLRRLERLRQEFVANVSHELKTPLSVIKACIETLLDGAVDDPEHRIPFMERISDQAERLHRLILDLLSLARIESESEVFEFQDVPLGSVVLACLERHRDRAEAKNQHLEAQCAGQVIPWRNGVARDGGSGSGAPVAPPAELTAWADEEAVSQILDNLVDNAVKYTPAGGRITVRWREEDGQVRLEIEDTGIGIAEPDLPRIFERFYRVDKARSRELGGTGLGLAIVKHLVQAMNGTVSASSQPGQGTQFTVRLPRRPAS
jgi:two-component system phosphate regulon sensor histidine kinase PhoR